MKTPKRILDLASLLVSSAHEQDALAQICADVEKLNDVFRQLPSALVDLSETAVATEVRLKAVSSMDASFHELTKAAINELVRTGELVHWNVFVQIVRESAERLGHHLVTAVSAEELSETQLDHAETSLQSILGGTISLKTRVEATILGGVRFEGVGWDLDQSFQGSLSRLQQAFHSS